MFGTATKYFLGLSGLFMVLATVYGVGTAANGNGDVGFYATVVLGTVAVTAGFLGWIALEAGDSASADRGRENAYTLVPAYWPVMSAAGLGFLTVGLVVNTQLAIFGLFVLIAAAIEWTLTAWADHRSADVESNYAVRRTLAMPFEVPLYGALAIAVPVYLGAGFLLSIGRNAASWTALGVASIVLVAAFVFYAKPDLKRPVLISIIGLGAVAVVVGGIVGLSNGTRPIEHHEDEEEPASAEEESAPGGQYEVEVEAK
ncbi:MAG: hypothetical protein GXP35_10755 [Actinobacteria bacterium]|nr:hypothetical protein [Actinomycetota bacterium]